MIARIATRGWNGSVAADGRIDTQVGVDVPWVELDGHRFDQVTAARVNSGNGATEVTITFLCAAEMVILGQDGTPL